METLFNGFTLQLAPGTFPLSTDSMILAHFVKLPKRARVLDLGSGCGTLGLLLCAKDPGCTVTGAEIDPAAHEAALQNIERNALSARLSSICCDLRDMKDGMYDVCVSNPPYFTGGPVSKATPIARREDTCSLPQLMDAAAKNIKYGGDFYIVHRPERLAQLCSLASVRQLEPKRLLLVRHKPDSPVNLIVLQCRKGGKPGLTMEELTLWDRDGNASDACRAIYHM